MPKDTRSREQARVWASFGGSFSRGRRGFVVLGRRWRCLVWPPRISVGLPRTPQGRLHKNFEREFSVNADPPPRVDFEDTGSAADQLLQTEDREVRFQTPEVGFAVKSSANVVLAQSAKKHRKAQESCISLASWE